MAAQEFAISGDFNVICDISGFKCKASETVIQWNGLRVLKRFADTRNPQDFPVKPFNGPNPTDTRPEGADLAQPHITAADL